MLHDYDGSNWVLTPHVMVSHVGVADGHVSVLPGAESSNLAGLLEALGHTDLANAVREVTELAEPEPEIEAVQ